MIIDRIDIHHVAMPLIQPWITATGKENAIECILVRMVSGNAQGWGESSMLAAPTYSPECASAAFVVIEKWLAPQLIGQDIVSGEDLQQRLSGFRGNQFAKAALDTAWWSLHSALTGRPLYQLLGGQRDVVQVGADFGVAPSLDDLIHDIGKAVDQRFSRIKLKFRPGWDVAMVKAVRQAFPDAVFHIDCNGAYTLSDVAMFKVLDTFNLAMIEQPLGYDDLMDHAKLAREIATPICLDESLNSLSRAKQAIELGSCRWANIKPGRVGGLTVARQIHDVFKSAGIPCWVGGMLESAIGAHLCTALATLDNFTYAADIFPTSKLYVDDLAEPRTELCRSEDDRPAAQALIRSPQPVESRLRDWTVSQASVEV